MAVIRRKTGPRFDVQALLAPLQELFKFQMQQQAQEESQKRQAQAARENDIFNSNRAFQNKALESRNPELLRSMIQGGGFEGRTDIDPTKFIPGQDEVQATVGKRIADAKTGNELPTENDIPGLLVQAGATTSQGQPNPVTGRPELPMGASIAPVYGQGKLAAGDEGALPSRPWETRRNPSILELIAQDKAKQGQLEEERLKQPVLRRWNENGQDFEEQSTLGDMLKAGPQPQGPKFGTSTPSYQWAIPPGSTTPKLMSPEEIRSQNAQRLDTTTPDFQWAIEPKTKETRLMTPDEIRTTGAGQPQTADMRNREMARGLVERSVSAIEDMSKQIITKVGPAQRAAAIERGAEAVFGTDPQFRTYQDARMALAGNLAVAQQGSRPSDADIKAIWLPLVPDAYRDTSESNALKWKLIRIMSSIPEAQEGVKVLSIVPKQP